jgi:hypothetical protein
MGSFVHEHSIDNNQRGGNKPFGQGNCAFTARSSSGAHVNTVSWDTYVAALMRDDHGRWTAVDCSPPKRLFAPEEGISLVHIPASLLHCSVS